MSRRAADGAAGGGRGGRWRRRIGRLLLALLAAALLLVGALAASLPLDRWLNRGGVAALTNTAIAAPPGAGPEARALRAHLALPPGTPGADGWPAVVMLHEFWGLRDDIVAKAEALAAEGYLVVAPDVFRGRTTAWLPAAIWNALATPEARVNADLDRVHAWLLARDDVDPARVLVMGFCYGGGAALDYSLHNPALAGTGVFYGSLVSDPVRLAALPGPLLGVFGAEDPSIPPRRVRAFEEALEAAGVPHEVTIYEGVGHAFVGGVAEIRAGGAPAAAWQQLLDFLEAVLAPAAPPAAAP